MKRTKAIISFLLSTVITLTVNVSVLAFQPTSHCTLIEEISKDLPKESLIAKAINTYPNVANWGANAPDLPYLQPGQVLERSPWADRFHYYKVGTFASTQLKKALDSKDLKNIAFAAGWVSHITGDLACHGVFVNAECGVYLHNDCTRGLHKELENNAEIYIFTKFGGNKISDYNKTTISNKFNNSGDIPFAFMNEVTNEVYGQSSSETEESMWTKALQLGINTGIGYNYIDYENSQKILSQNNRISRLESAFEQAKKHGVTLLTQAESGDYSGFTDRWNLDVGLSKSPMSSLTVTVETGKSLGAGTDDHIYFSVELKDSTVKEWKLDKVNYNDFEYGDSDEYYLYINDINFNPKDVAKTYLTKKNVSSIGADWYLKGFNVNVNGMDVVEKESNKWIDSSNNKEIVNVDWSNVTNTSDPSIE
ncbi:zinc dependent phospholipase C family protein [Clostridium sp. Marseille-Q2269]|uniref:zinc dependent phospholipase C family protein n=1 Tax=Clostridium sp. Marseille-Q2269 TaxID=2942205 RepID=UPI0020731F76|nr:zinc dependent phospholipase C family protein [Clostridium sp. Marseille-Q2269]